jgi:DNA-binding transcriptional regulator YiaG
MAKNMNTLCAKMTADEFRSIRLRWNISAQTLAKIIGVHGARSIYRWEAGHTEVPDIIARFMRIVNDERFNDNRTPFMQILLDHIELSEKKTA